MKLLFDQNLSHRLVAFLEDLYPGSVHVRQVELAQASDLEVWEYAKDRGLVIVSKDSDFHQLSFLYGPPPKALWFRLGNCTTAEIEQVLRQRHVEVHGGRDIASLLLRPIIKDIGTTPEEFLRNR